MCVFAIVLLALSSASAYLITSPGSDTNWNTTGPNFLVWERVSTDPLNFTGVLTNVNTGSNQVMNDFVDGTLNIVACSPPSGGWPSGSGFRVNMVQDPEHLNTILAQSGEFNITAVSSNTSTTSSTSFQPTTSIVATTTASSPSLSSSDTSTSPTGVSAASLSADTQTGLLAAVTALAIFIFAPF